jgi:hypothetical protein
MPSEQPRETTVDENAEHTVDTKARVSMVRFYDALEKSVKRYRPDAYIPYMTRLFQDTRTDQKRRYYLPPHRVLHSIEANCAFYKSGYTESPDWSAVVRIMNVYVEHSNEMHLWATSSNLQHFVLMMYREQIELQCHETREYMARMWELFVANPEMQIISSKLRETWGLTHTEWLQLSFLTWAAAKLNPGSFFSKNAVLNCRELHVRESALDAFLRVSSLSPDEIGKCFLASRKEYPAKFHSLIRSVFLECPIVRFPDGRMVSPHEGLLFMHSGTGLYRLSRDIEHFYDAFSHGFERYVERLLGYISNRGRLLTEKTLQKASSGKTCDFLLETADATVLVECKACMQTSNILTNSVIQRDNSTWKVVKGLRQIVSTATDAANGVFAPLGVDVGKNVLGIVVTFGDIPFANSDWYFDSFFNECFREHAKKDLLPAGMMVKKPIVISVRVLQDLVRLLNTCGTSFSDVYADKEKQPYLQVGDWETYLMQRLRTISGKIAGLPHVERNVQRMYESLGIPQWVRPDAGQSGGGR